MDQYSIGLVATYPITYRRNADNSLADPVDPYVVITFADGVTTVTVTPTRTSIGQFSWSWTVPAGAPVGVYSYIEYGTIDGVVCQSDIQQFEVVSAGGTVTPGPTPAPQLNLYQIRVGQFAQAPTGIFPNLSPNDYAGNRDAAIQAAVREYSIRRPRHLVTVANPLGAGVFEYLIPPGIPIVVQGGTAGVLNLSGWNEDQYFFERVVFPYGQYFAYQKNEIEWKFWTVYKKEDGNQYIQFWDMIPSAGLKMALYYCAPHVVADLVATNNPVAGANVAVSLPSTAGLNGGLAVRVQTGSTSEWAQIVPSSVLATSVGLGYVTLTNLVNNYTSPIVSVDTISTEHPQDIDAVCHLATSILLGQIANLYADKQRSTVKGDSIDYGSKSKQYTDRAVAERKLYDTAMAHVPTVDGATMQWQTSQTGGDDRLVHRKMWT